MSPRGVSIPDLRKRLFDAAERVLTDRGPVALTGRAVTGEAGCATGVLYRHFSDFDQFLDDFYRDRVARIIEPLVELPSQAGERTVAANLQSAAEAMLGPRARALAALAAARPQILSRNRDAPMPAAGPPTASPEPAEPTSATSALTAREALDRAVVEYLRAEQRLARRAGDVDVEALTLVFVATVHDLLLHGRRPGMGDERETVARVIPTVVAR
jgi:AcrR family transcriptional regulator